jgi:hypothetical protein
MAVRFSASLVPKSRRRNRSIVALSALAAAAALVAAPGLATASPPSRAQTDSSSTFALQFHKAIANHSNQCLDVSGGSTADGAAVIQWPCHGGANQDWLLVPTGYGAFFVVARHSGQCLDVRGASHADGTPIIQWPCNGGANQQWVRRTHGSLIVLVARHSGKCLYVSGASMSNGAAIVQWRCLPAFGAAAQRWRIS